MSSSIIIVLVVLSLVTLVLVELLFRLPLFKQALGLFALYKKIFRLLGAKTISDHWKEKMIPAYNFNAIGLLFKIALQLAVLFIFIFAVLSLLENILLPQPSVWELIQSWEMLIFLFVLPLVYWWLRTRLFEAKR
jgi:hypothetical protein